MLVVTRSAAIGVLNRIIVAPITRSARQIPTEIALGPAQGLPEPCVATFDNLQPMPRRSLTSRVGHLTADQAQEICRAMEALTDC